MNLLFIFHLQNIFDIEIINTLSVNKVDEQIRLIILMFYCSEFVIYIPFTKYF